MLKGSRQSVLHKRINITKGCNNSNYRSITAKHLTSTRILVVL